MINNKKKEFVVKHVYTDVNRFDIHVWYYNIEEEFGFKWTTAFLKQANDFILGLRGERDGSDGEWTMDATISAKLKTIVGEETFVENFNFSNESGWNFFENNRSLHKYIVDGSFTVEFHVTINKITGIEEVPRQILRSFDESTKEFSDVVLVVKDQKFYVNKMYLASHSPYFKALFLGKFNESNQAEVELKDIDPWDFQNFLEVLHGEPAIHEESVEGILQLADMYDSNTAIRQCEKFLLNDSKQVLKVKFHLAVQYKLEKLKNECMSKIETIGDIKSVVPEDASSFDPEVLKELLNKSFQFNNQKF